jgi:DNA-directed RNA polymerase subunit beta'
VRSWSKGESKIGTINYHALQAGKGRPFLRTIFGPTRLGMLVRKIQAHQHKGVICDRCGVEVQLARVRREQMGPRLAVPFAV